MIWILRIFWFLLLLATHPAVGGTSVENSKTIQTFGIRNPEETNPDDDLLLFDYLPPLRSSSNDNSLFDLAPEIVTEIPRIVVQNGVKTTQPSSPSSQSSGASLFDMEAGYTDDTTTRRAPATLSAPSLFDSMESEGSLKLRIPQPPAPPPEAYFPSYSADTSSQLNQVSLTWAQLDGMLHQTTDIAGIISSITHSGSDYHHRPSPPSPTVNPTSIPRPPAPPSVPQPPAPPLNPQPPAPPRIPQPPAPPVPLYQTYTSQPKFNPSSKPNFHSSEPIFVPAENPSYQYFPSAPILNPPSNPSYQSFSSAPIINPPANPSSNPSYQSFPSAPIINSPANPTYTSFTPASNPSSNPSYQSFPSAPILNPPSKPSYQSFPSAPIINPNPSSNPSYQSFPSAPIVNLPPNINPETLSFIPIRIPLTDQELQEMSNQTPQGPPRPPAPPPNIRPPAPPLPLSPYHGSSRSGSTTAFQPIVAPADPSSFGLSNPPSSYDVPASPAFPSYVIPANPVIPASQSPPANPTTYSYTPAAPPANPPSYSYIPLGPPAAPPASPPSYSYVPAAPPANPPTHSYVLAAPPANPPTHSYVLAAPPANPPTYSYVPAAPPANPPSHTYVLAAPPANHPTYNYVSAAPPANPPTYSYVPAAPPANPPTYSYVPAAPPANPPSHHYVLAAPPSSPTYVVASPAVPVLSPPPVNYVIQQPTVYQPAFLPATRTRVNLFRPEKSKGKGKGKDKGKGGRFLSGLQSPSNSYGAPPAAYDNPASDPGQLDDGTLLFTQPNLDINYNYRYSGPPILDKKGRSGKGIKGLFLKGAVILGAMGGTLTAAPIVPSIIGRKKRDNSAFPSARMLNVSYHQLDDSLFDSLPYQGAPVPKSLWKELERYMPPPDAMGDAECIQKSFCENLVQLNHSPFQESLLFFYSALSPEADTNQWLERSLTAARKKQCSEFYCLKPTNIDTNDVPINENVPIGDHVQDAENVLR